MPPDISLAGSTHRLPTKLRIKKDTTKTNAIYARRHSFACWLSAYQPPLQADDNAQESATEINRLNLIPSDASFLIAIRNLKDRHAQQTTASGTRDW